MAPPYKDDFRQLLDERFGRVDDSLRAIKETLSRQDDQRGRQFANLELKYTQLDAKVDEKVNQIDTRLKVVSGISAGAGGVIGAVLAWFADHFFPHLPK